LIRILGDLS